MGHSSTIRLSAVLAGWLLAGVALAQQGLIQEPWSAARAASAPALPSSGAMPESGLPLAPSAVPSAKPERPPAGRVIEPEGAKWSPPVVTLLVDPWERSAHPADPPHPRWLPQTAEIVDPWAAARPAPTPRVATRPADAPARSTIF